MNPADLAYAGLARQAGFIAAHGRIDAQPQAL